MTSLDWPSWDPYHLIHHHIFCLGWSTRSSRFSSSAWCYWQSIVQRLKRTRWWSSSSSPPGSVPGSHSSQSSLLNTIYLIGLIPRFLMVKILPSSNNTYKPSWAHSSLGLLCHFISPVSPDDGTDFNLCITNAVLTSYGKTHPFQSTPSYWDSMNTTLSNSLPLSLGRHSCAHHRFCGRSPSIVTTTLSTSYQTISSWGDCRQQRCPSRMVMSNPRFDLEIFREKSRINRKWWWWWW